jgi:hypothetical protein
MDAMTYSGVTYQTSNIGTYRSPNPNALTSLGSHRFSSVRRAVGETLIDPFMMEAFANAPMGYDFSKLEGWSRSYYTVEGHLDSIYKIQSTRRFNKPFDRSMVATDIYCTQYFENLGTVSSMDFHTQLEQVPFEPTSSAGIGIPGRKGDDGNLDRAVRQATATINNCIRNGIQGVINSSTPDMAYTRTQLTQLTEGLKVRNVFGQAFQYILIEGLSAYPLMEFFSRNDTFFFVGKDPRTSVPDLLEQLKRESTTLMSIDWSAFDTSVENWEILDAFDLLESLLTFPNLKSRACFEFSKVFFINRKIAAPDSQVYMKHAAVPSGSFYTMIIDSIVNWRRILYLHHRAYDCFPKSVYAQGDDSLLGTYDHVTPEGLAIAIPPTSKWTMNPYKCPVGKSGSSVPFLQRYLKWGDQARKVDRVERLAIYPEYEVTDPLISSYRARALWEDSNYESVILGYATSYLESKYGVPTEDQVPNKYRSFLKTLYESKERAGEN